MFTTIKDYCVQNNIKWFPIYLTFTTDEKGGIVKTISPIKHKSYHSMIKLKNGQEVSSFKPKQTDFSTLTDEQIAERQTMLTNPMFKYDIKHIAMDTRSIYHIDIDTPTYSNMFNKICEIAPYFTSTTKIYGKHIMVTGVDFTPPAKRNQLQNLDSENNHIEGVELLSGQWSYAPLDGEMYNANKDVYICNNLPNLVIGYNKQPKTKKLKINHNNPVNNTAVNTTVVNTVVQNKPQNLKESEFNKIFEHGENILLKYLDAYDDWTRIVWSLKAHNVNLYEFANTLSNKSKKYDETSFKKTWDGYNMDNSRLSIATFFHYSKISNLEKFKEIRVKFCPKSIEESIQYQTTEVVTRSFCELFGDEFICKDKIIYHYNGTIWEISKNAPRYKFTRDFTNVFLDYYKNVLDEMKKTDPDSAEYKLLSEKGKNVKNLINKLQTNKFIKDCTIDSIETYIENQNVKFELNPYTFCFNNKVYDLKNNTFVDVPNREDYMTLSTGYNYREPTEDEMKEIDKMICRVFPIEEERTLYMIFLATGLFGKTLEKFVLANGGGRNGKGFLNELTVKMLGGYAYTCGNAVLMSPIKDGANPALANMNHKRFVVYREPDTSAYSRLNNSTIKELTGGSEINSRGLYSSDTTTNMKCTSVLECNTKPKMSGEIDNAIVMRLLDIHFRSTFTNIEEDVDEHNYIFLGDDNVKSLEYQEKHKFALFHILLKYWKIYQEEKMKIDAFVPTTVKDRVREYLTDGNTKLSWFLANYETVDDDTEVVKIDEVLNKFKSTEDFYMMNKTDKRDCSYKNFILFLLPIHIQGNFIEKENKELK